MLHYCTKQLSGQEKDSVLSTLTKLILEKSPLPKSGISLEDWKPYVLNTKSKDRKTR